MVETIKTKEIKKQIKDIQDEIKKFQGNKWVDIEIATIFYHQSDGLMYTNSEKHIGIAFYPLVDYIQFDFLKISQDSTKIKIENSRSIYIDERSEHKLLAVLALTQIDPPADEEKEYTYIS